MALAAVPPDPDMWVHLCPGAEPGLTPGAVDALAAGLAALAGAVLDDAVLDEVVADACVACAPAAELVEALAIVSPNASVAPSMAAPAAVAMRGLEILTRFSLLCCGRGSGPGPPGRVQ
jgi:hypothetical protein